MQTEPDLTHSAILTTLRQAYGFPFNRLLFHPTYWLGYCYAVEDTNGQKYFLKVHPKTEQYDYTANSPAFYLPLTDQLYRTGRLPNIPHPYRSLAGQFSTPCAGFDLELYNFIPAQLIGFVHLDDRIIRKLARLVGILHASLPYLHFDHPFIDNYPIAFEAELLADLQRLPGLRDSARPAQQQMARLLIPRQPEILAHLERLHALRHQMLAMRKPPVICHTDLHGANLMLDDQGQLYILDWDNALIAPPEHDLFFIANEERFWEVYLPEYESQAGRVALHPQVFAFYYYRRAMEDLEGWIMRILSGRGTAETDQTDLTELIATLDGMHTIEPVVAEIHRRLVQLNRLWLAL